MGLEVASFIHELNPANPLGSDAKSQGDDHIRLTKFCVQNTFINVDGQVTATHGDLNKTANISNGVYTPVITPLSGFVGWSSPSFFYIRVGNTVKVEGVAIFDVSATGGQFTMTVPIARAGGFGDSISATGLGRSDSGSGTVIVTSVFGSTNLVQVGFINAADGTFRFSFTYKLD
jgi:hypothetical protein